MKSDNDLGDFAALVPGPQEAFVRRFLPTAQRTEAQTGVPALYSLGQAALESGWGQSAPSHNLFGIKGPGQVLQTQEFQGGQNVSLPQSFRSYSDPESAFLDYGNLIASPRYRHALDAPTPADFAHAVHRAGYATDPAYGSKLAAVLERVGGLLGISSAQAAEVPESAPAALGADAQPQGVDLGDFAALVPSAPAGAPPAPVADAQPQGADDLGDFAALVPGGGQGQPIPAGDQAVAPPSMAEEQRPATAGLSPGERTQAQDFLEGVSPSPESSAGGAFARGAAGGVIPAAGALAGGLGAAALVATLPVTGIPAVVLGALAGLAGAVGGGYVAGKGQEAALDALLPAQERADLDAQRQADVRQHPVASLAGELVPQAVVARPSLKNLQEAGVVLGWLRTAEGRAALKADPAFGAKVGNLLNVALGTGLGAGVEVARQAEPGAGFDPGRLALAAGAGAVLTKNPAWMERLMAPRGTGTAGEPPATQPDDLLKREQERRVVQMRDELDKLLKETYGEPPPSNGVDAPSETFVNLDSAPESPPPALEAPQHQVGGLAVRELPLDRLKLSEDVPQFKAGADEQGVVEPLGGTFDRTGVSPIQVWERANGDLEVISGRHRLDLARRSGEATIPAQVHREAEGFDALRAARLDAELNIRDGQGEVKDYANYFRNSDHTEETADAAGLLARAKGRAGFRVAMESGDTLFGAHQSGRINDERAVAILDGAGRDEGLQNLGLKLAQEGKSPDLISNTLRAVSLMSRERGDGGQVDLFGFDDSAMQAALDMARRAAAVQRELRANLSTVKGAARKPAVAQRFGVDVNDPGALQAKVREMQGELARWNHWPNHPDLVARVRGDAEEIADSEPAGTRPEASDPGPANPAQAGIAQAPESAEVEARPVPGEGGEAASQNPVFHDLFPPPTAADIAQSDAQRLKDAQDESARNRNATGQAGFGALDAADHRQADLTGGAEAPSPRQAYSPQAEYEEATGLETYDFKPRVRQTQTGEWASGVQRITSAADVAHVAASLRKEAQEHFVAITADEDGNLLRVHRLAKGSPTRTEVDPATLGGAVANTPGARRAWFVHNHPSGEVSQSRADKLLAQRLHTLLVGSGVEPRGMIVVGGDGREFSVYEPQVGETRRQTTAAARTGAVPVYERRLFGRVPDGKPVSTGGEVAAAFRRMPDEAGVMLLDAQLRPVGFVPLSDAEMANLRSEGASGPLRRLLQGVDETNAVHIAPRIKDAAQVDKVGANLAGFAQVAGLNLLDVFGPDLASRRAAGVRYKAGTFYANPFGPAIDFARTAGVPRSTLAVGGIAGALEGVADEGNTHKPFSPEWWAFLGKRALEGAALAGGLKAARVTGERGVAALALRRIGLAIDGLPIIGRGPVELRRAQQEQRALRSRLERQTREFGEALLKQYTPEERAMMSDLIENRGIVPELGLIHQQAEQLDDYLAYATQRMKAVGMLHPDTEEGGYLHRYYEKHLLPDGGEQRAARRQMGMSGSWSVERGTVETFGREFLSPEARKLVADYEAAQAEVSAVQRDMAKWERKAKQAEKSDDPDLFMEKYDEAMEKLQERLDEAQGQLEGIAKTPIHEYLGQQADADGNPTLRSFFFTREELARVAGEDGTARLALKDMPPPGSLDPRLLPETGLTQPLETSDRVWSLRGSDARTVALHRDWTRAERDAWGEIRDVGYRYVRGMAEVAHDLSLGELFHRLAQRSDWVSAEPRREKGLFGREWTLVPEGNVRPGSKLKRYGALAGKYVRPDIWAGLQSYGRSPLGESSLARSWRRYYGQWKAWKTVFNPGTHFNNSFSNAEMLLLGGYTPADLGRAVLEWPKGEPSGLFKEADEAGLFGHHWGDMKLHVEGGDSTLADLAERLRTQPWTPEAELVTTAMMDAKAWWIKSRAAVAGAEGKYQTGVELARMVGAPLGVAGKQALRPLRAATRAMERLYHFEDSVFKLAVYGAERRKGSSPAEAVRKANALFFDYNDVPLAIRFLRDVPVLGSPFISYTYLSFQAIAKTLAEHPERALALAMGAHALSAAALQMEGDEPGQYWPTRRAEETLAPPWERGSTWWGMPDMVHVPGLDGYRLALGRAHAGGNPFADEAGDKAVARMPVVGEAWGPTLFGSSPITSAIVDLSTNQDWKGKPIWHEHDPAQAKATKILNYLYQAAAPSVWAWPGSYHQQRILEGMANDAAEARAKGEPTGLAGSVVERANQVAEALGFGQFTGRDRMDQPILTREAWLAAHGVKLRPERWDQALEFESRKIRQEITGPGGIVERLRQHERDAGEGRLTEGQRRAAQGLAQEQIGEALGRQRKAFDAAEFLRRKKKAVAR